MIRPFQLASSGTICVALSACVIAVERLGTAGPYAAAEAVDARRFTVTGFDKVDLSSSDRLVVVRGDLFAVTASGDPRGVAALAIAAEGDTLHIGRTPGQHRDQGAIVTVTMPSLRAVSLSGSGSIRADGVAGHDFVGALGGSGSMALSGLKATSVRLSLDGSGSITAAGDAAAVAIDLGGSGAIDTRGLATPALTIDLGGSGSVNATSSRAAAIDAGGSGSVRVAGGPRCDIRKRGFASVRCG